jgi:hypothetical protein
MHKLSISNPQLDMGQKSMRKVGKIFEPDKNGSKKTAEMAEIGKVLFDTHYRKKYNIETRAYIAI